MNKILPIYTFIFILFALACSNDANSQQKVNSANDRTNSQETNANKTQNAELQKQIEQIASEAKGRVGVAATILETGETVSLNGGERFPMQSVYKLPIGMAVLRQIDAGKLKLDERVRVEKSDFVRRGMHSPIRDKNPNGTDLTVNELLSFSVSESDGTASDVLFNLAGGAEEIAKFLNELEVKDLIVADTEKEIGRDWKTQYRNYATPQSAIALLRSLHERRGLSESSQQLMLKILVETSTGPKRLKGLLPKDAIVAHKTGTSGTNKDGITAATNDIGIITLPNGKHLAIAVFVSDSPADEATREGVIAKIAKAAWDKWSK